MMEKIKVWNWQRIHNENASVQNWMYKMLMDKRITCIKDGSGSIKLLDGSEDIGHVGDYLVWFHDTDTLRIVKKDDFETNYERMT